MFYPLIKIIRICFPNLAKWKHSSALKWYSQLNISKQHLMRLKYNFHIAYIFSSHYNTKIATHDLWTLVFPFSSWKRLTEENRTPEVKPNERILFRRIIRKMCSCNIYLFTYLLFVLQQSKRAGYTGFPRMKYSALFPRTWRWD